MQVSYIKSVASGVLFLNLLDPHLLRGSGSEQTKLPNLLQTKKKNILHELGLFCSNVQETLCCFFRDFQKSGGCVLDRKGSKRHFFEQMFCWFSNFKKSKVEKSKCVWVWSLNLTFGWVISPITKKTIKHPFIDVSMNLFWYHFFCIFWRGVSIGKFYIHAFLQNTKLAP